MAWRYFKHGNSHAKIIAEDPNISEAQRLARVILFSRTRFSLFSRRPVTWSKTVRGSSLRVSLTTLIYFVKVSLQAVGFVIGCVKGIASYGLLTSSLFFLLKCCWTWCFRGTPWLFGALRSHWRSPSLVGRSQTRLLGPQASQTSEGCRDGGFSRKKLGRKLP